MSIYQVTISITSGVNMSKSSAVLPSAVGGLTLLEQLHASCSQKYAKCPNPGAPRLLGVNAGEGTAVHVQAACKKWDCPVCGKRNAQKWIARILTGINHYIKNGSPDWYLMTLTAHENWRGSEASLQNLRQGWKKLSNRMWRKWGKGHYVRVFEHHKDGSFHMHFCIDIEMPYTSREVWNKETSRNDTKFRCDWLKGAARTCGMGFQADYRPSPSPGVTAWYVAKYLAKSIGDNGRDWPKNLRRVQPSRDWPKLPPIVDASQYSWKFVGSRGELMVQAMNLWLYDQILVFDMETGRELNTDDFLLDHEEKLSHN